MATSSDINAKIRQLTSEKNSYETEKSKYKTSLTYAKKLLNSINSSLKYLEQAEDSIKKYFVIGTKTADNGEIKNEKEELNKIVKKLNNMIIPGINDKISSLDSKIKSIEKQITELKRQLAISQTSSN